MDRLSRMNRGLVVALAALAVLGGSASAQPANDLCESAAVLQEGIPVAGTTVDAALDRDFSEFCQADVSDVWYVFSAPAAGPYVFSASGADNQNLSLSLVSACDFPFAVYGCSVGSASAGPSLEQNLFFPGELAYVRVGNLSAPGQAFTVSAAPLPPPANDECAGATVVALGAPLPTNNLAATTSVELPMAELCSSIAPGIAAGADVFFSFTPDFTGHFDISTCGSEIDTVVSVHSGCPVTQANAIACNDNSPIPSCSDPFDSHSSYLAGVELQAGVTYYIRVGSVLPYNDFTGELGEPGRASFTLSVQSGATVSPPANDLCTSAEVLAADTFVNGTTVLATGGQESPCGADDVWDVWYSFTSAEAVPTVFEFMVGTPAFNSQSTLSAYSTCGGAPTVCQAFNPFLNPEQRIVLALNPTETVLVRVAGQVGAQDNFTLVGLTLGPAATNLACGSAATIAAGTPAFVDTTTAPTTLETVCGDGLTDVYGLWYEFTAPQAGYFRFSADLAPGGGSVASLSVHDDCGGDPLICSLTPDDTSPGPGAAATIELASGQQVFIRTAMAYAERGQYELSVNGPLAPPPTVTNDACASAKTVASVPYTDSTDITLATPDQDVCYVDGEPLSPTLGGIWYTYTPDVDRTFRATVTADNPFNGFAAVFTGSGCGSLTQVGCAGSFFGPPPTVPMVGGTTYWILVAVRDDGGVGAIPYGATVDVEFEAAPAPANDHCVTAEEITSTSVAFTVDTFGADAQSPAPSCAGLNDSFADVVWYTFTTQTAGTLDVEGRRNPEANFDHLPAGALYSGPCGALTEVACDNPTSGFFLTDRFEFTTELDAGQTYYLAVGAWREPLGDLTDIAITYTGTFGSACPGDYNGDDTVDLADLIGFNTDWQPHIGTSQPAGTNGDYNGDGFVDLADLIGFNTDWQPSIGVPCP